MYRPRPLTDKLTCDVCGKPAKWYDREFHSTYVLGEALCDDCANHWHFEIGGKIKESHIENGIKIIDKFELYEISLCP